MAITPLALSLVGVVLTIVLVREHATVIEGGFTQGLFCGGSGRNDCGAVAAHDSSWVLGVPLALWGLLFYVLMTGISLASLALGHPGTVRASTVGLTLALAAVVFDAYLAWTMVVQIGAVCLNCVATYMVNVLLIAVFAIRVRTANRDSSTSEVGPATVRRFRWAPPAIAVFTVVGMAAAAYFSWTPVALTRQFARQEAETFLAKFQGPPAVAMSRFAGQPARGPEGAPIQIAMMSDFQCPYCRALSQHLGRLQRRHPGAIRVIFVNAPVSSKCHPMIRKDIHEDACRLAEIGECAAESGKFWEYHDLLYGVIPHPQVTLATVASRLGEAGLQPAAIQACLGRGIAATGLARDTTILRELKLNSVPALVINGHIERGGIYPDALGAIVHALLSGR